MNGELLLALETDLVLCAHQVGARFGLGLAALRADPSLAVHEVRLFATGTSSRSHPAQVITPRGAALPDDLEHTLGVAAMRGALGVAPQGWKRVSSSAIDAPDAVFAALGLEVAVEFDAGAYPKARVLRKASFFCGCYDRQVWGTPSAARAETLRSWTLPWRVAEVLTVRSF